ncbi:hypothetical protein KC19_3G111900 [Ceratodon purpureus]|uniref:TIR domain-containing protein n=1 Tax=Ceratodon purpureus TaxID=3225 RepID=A0A8T0IJQ0_CERPU|nr:hypothetical protein KC19_3G111900 [Ceratodon purpureus]
MESDVWSPRRLHLGEDMDNSNTDKYAKYDVFISHRGPDTKTGFVSFLHKDLVAAGLRPFLDCKSIDVGDDCWENIEHAIKKTPIAVVVFSERFTQSEWCLRELHLILHTPSVQMLPVFYNLRPSEVRFPESGQLKDGFEKLSSRYEKDVIAEWRADLVQASNVMGWEHSRAHPRLEGDIIREIVEKVFELANKPLPLDIGEHAIGVEKIAQEIIEKLHGDGRILMLGLWGMGGIGKSTLARTLYNRMKKSYVANCYIEDVTEKVAQGGVVKVQNCILKDLCKNESIEIEDKSKGKVILEERLCEKKILLVLDDVCDNDEMYYWISSKMLRRGSMCIVTSRNRRIFEKAYSFDMNHEVYIHDVQGLSSINSQRVFTSYAFGGEKKMKQGFEKLVVNVSEACRGVPLVLKVCGALLKDEEDVDIWNDVLKKLNCGTIMDEDKIFKCLRISYDILQQDHQEMFLDIACALLGQSKDLAIRLWKSHGWSGPLGVRSLVEKALVTLDKRGCFGMHDHLRDMGREIVKKERIHNGVIRRLWMPESLILLKRDKQLPQSLETLIIYDNYMSYGNHRSLLDLDVSFMRNLRIFRCGHNINVPSSFPENMGWFGRLPQHISDVGNCTLPIVPQNNKLVIMNLEDFYAESLGESICNATNLEVLNLKCIWTPLALWHLPDSFGGLENLQDLDLSASVIQILPESFGKLSKLKVLKLPIDLISLPHSFGGLVNLRQLNLANFEIQSLPESFGELRSLEVLNLSNCDKLIMLPQSFGRLRNLRNLTLKGSYGLQSLPNSFGELINLEVLDLPWNLLSLPQSFGGLVKLRHLDLEKFWIQSLPESFGKLSSMEVLNLSNCDKLVMLPHSFGGMRNLRDLTLRGTGIQNLPESFGELINLEVLDLPRSLLSLPHSFGGLVKLRHLDLEYSAIQSLPESFGEMSSLEVLIMSNCNKLTVLPHSFGGLRNLRDLTLRGSGIQSLPESFGELSTLEVLNLSYCAKLIILPDSFGGLSNLRDLTLKRSRIQRLPESFGELSNLEVLNLCYCDHLVMLPASLCSLTNLWQLEIRGSGIQILGRF